MVQYYKIAGLVVQMDTFGRTLAQAEPYLCEKAEPQIIINTDQQREQYGSKDLDEDDCEYIATGGWFYRYLVAYSGIVLHSSAVVVDGRAYLFSAPSGTGKSTHTQLWLDTFGDRAFMLNDDKPALRLEDGAWYAYGTPWSGKYDINKNERVPLAGICFLKRGEINEIKPFGGSAAVFSLLEQTLRPVNPDNRVKIINLIEKLVNDVPIWQLSCNMEKEAAMVSYRAMSGCDE